MFVTFRLGLPNPLKLYRFSVISIATESPESRKYAINVKFPDFVLGTAKEYDLDMNFKDPVDGLTVMDDIQNEIKHYKRDTNTYERQLIELEAVYGILRSRGVKHAHELD
ncbi:hypothetical protein JHJ32_10230 [Parapedobacter sp. ISTM3]|uniref:hypothetical protein n=1 Tax=Parapedobacter sp. ISTM3 TaxID=2800130 RepID=UPI0019044479|nr:hypothetical protein [Parapedobacter sp. ISTM3]MBK1440362.1 hypothetical protein [Parapedobacter sp. ISTM3]